MRDTLALTFFTVVSFNTGRSFQFRRGGPRCGWAGGERANGAADPDFAREGVHAHLHELGTEGIADLIVELRTPRHDRITLVEALRGVGRNARGKILGIDFDGASRAANGIAQGLDLAVGSAQSG